MRQSLHLHGRSHPAAFIGVGFHEFHSGRGVEKQIPDNDGTAVGAAGFAFVGDDTGFQSQGSAADRAWHFGQQVNAADGSNGCQSFTTETHGIDGGQILGSAQLAGGVAQKGGFGILGAHTAAVVRDPQEGHAAVPDFYGDLGGTGIHGIFQQLLDHGGRTLHHFAGGDEVGNMGG